MPETEQIVQPEPAVEKTYLQTVLDELGVTPELNTIDILYFDADKNDNSYKPVPIFRESEKGYDIFVYTVDALPINFAKEGSRYKINEFKITRLKEPYINKNGSTVKYLIPGKEKAYPFFPPQLVKKFQNKQKIQTLILTEGYKKAFKGAMHGLDIVGLISITTLEDKVLGEMHEDILRIIKDCEVERVIFLHDGDCLNPLKSGTVEVERDAHGAETGIYAGGKDLYKRPNIFFQSVFKFRELLLSHNVDMYFAHVKSDEIENNPKGLDDVLIQFRGNETVITDDLLAVSRNPNYFYKLDITRGAYTKLNKHFLIDDVNKFYNHWAELRPSLKNRKFVFHGTQYQWSDEKKECLKLIPAEAKDYVCVGTEFYKKIKMPNQHGINEDYLKLWNIATINRQHTKDFWKHIPTYDAFCNLPSHDNYQPVISNCYNVYYPVFHPEPADETESFDKILSLIKHIFGSGKLKYKAKGETEAIEIDEWELGLDYIQILFQKPQEKLPVLCLVSKENETGKSTFCDLLRAIFQGNITSINNQDLKDNFNAHWITKLIVYCSETLLEKQEYSERIKTLSTDQKANVNNKGVSQYEIDIFLHFILLSNNETNFIKLTEYDTRFWIRKIPVLKDKDPNYLTDMISEVPAFVAYLRGRQLKTKKESRMWFSYDLTRTDALDRVIRQNRPGIEKEIRTRMAEMFLDFAEGDDGKLRTEIKMSMTDIKEHILPRVTDFKYLREVLKEIMKLPQVEKTARYEFPAWDISFNQTTNRKEKNRVLIPGNGRPYIFHRKDFVDPETDPGLDGVEKDEGDDLPF